MIKDFKAFVLRGNVVDAGVCAFCTPEVGAAA